MGDSVAERDRPTPARGVALKVLLLTAFAVAMFLAGRLWSLREVRAAQRAAGLAEEQRLALRAELTECRNALLLRRARSEASGGDVPEADGAIPAGRGP